MTQGLPVPSIVKQGPAKYPATAHFPGAVKGKTCGDCVHLDPCSNKHRGRCVEHWRMRGLAWRIQQREACEDKLFGRKWWSGLWTIAAGTPACKYFVKRCGGTAAATAEQKACSTDAAPSIVEKPAAVEP